MTLLILLCHLAALLLFVLAAVLTWITARTGRVVRVDLVAAGLACWAAAAVLGDLTGVR